MRTLIPLGVALIVMGGCGRSPLAATDPGRGDCSLFQAQSTSPYILPYEPGQSLLPATRSIRRARAPCRSSFETPSHTRAESKLERPTWQVAFE